MDVRRIRLSLWILGGVVLTLTLLGVWHLFSHRSLTPMEKRLVGAWSFPRPGDPSTLHVYRFRDDGRVVEEHYYLTSATPTTPRLRMHGVWRIESDGRLVVERPEGMDGAMVEVSRQIRNFGGDQKYDHPLLRRTYKLITADATRLTFRHRRLLDSGQYEEAELMMVPSTRRRSPRSRSRSELPTVARV